MRALAPLALLFILSSLPLAEAAPQIPSSAMPGRERERFIDPFPQRERAGPVVTVPNEARPSKRRTCRVRGSKIRKRC